MSIELTKNIKDLLHVVHGGIGLDQGSNRLICALDCLWDTIDILRLDDGFQVILQNFGEVV